MTGRVFNLFFFWNAPPPRAHRSSIFPTYIITSSLILLCPRASLPTRRIMWLT